MNRSLTNVLFGGISAGPAVADHKIEGTITKTTVDDTVEALANADSVILVCISHLADVSTHFLTLFKVVGYGMAVAKAQYAISDVTAMLRKAGVNVRVRIHHTPVER